MMRRDKQWKWLLVVIGRGSGGIITDPSKSL